MKNNFLIDLSNSDIIIKESYLYHSFGRRKGEIKFIDYGYAFDSHLDNKICLIEYNSGEGLFSFIKKLPQEICLTALIIIHPENRPHDHFQYSICEDPRFPYVLHASKSDLAVLKNGMVVELVSNAKVVGIKII